MAVGEGGVKGFAPGNCPTVPLAHKPLADCAGVRSWGLQGRRRGLDRSSIFGVRDRMASRWLAATHVPTAWILGGLRPKSGLYSARRWPCSAHKSRRTPGGPRSADQHIACLTCGFPRCSPRPRQVHRTQTSNGLVNHRVQVHCRVYVRWRRDAPTQLWQMDLIASVFLADGRERRLVTGIAGPASDRAPTPPGTHTVAYQRSPRQAAI